MLADGYVARHATVPKVETAAELGARLVGEARIVALDRALANLGRGVEALQADIDVFQDDPAMHLRYLDAREEALALHGEVLGWEPEPEPEPDDGGSTDE
jgi:hypothetical protein